MKLKDLRALVPAVAAIFWIGFANASFSADSTAPTNSVLRLHFLTNSAGETLVKHGDKPAAPLNIVSNVLNVTQLSKTRRAQLSLIPEDALIAVTSAQFPGWTAELPPKQSVSFSFDYPRLLLDLQTSDLNRQPVHLSFPDGAAAEMDGRADGRFELMDDGTYAFFGAGPMSGINADGAQVRFGNVFPPLFGGKLIAPPANNPNARFTRASPVTALTFLGQIDSGISARVGTETVPLETGRLHEIRAENGAHISAMFNPQTRTVDWTVRRGLFRITVESFRCWKALGASSQSASMQWDTNGFLMQIKNNNGPGAFQKTLLVNLNPNLNVSVGDSATFQYGRTGDCSTFVATAHGGETILYNSQTGRYVRLDEGNMNIISGTPDTLPGIEGTPKTQLRLAWKTDKQIELRSPGESITVDLDGQETFQADPSTRVDVKYSGPEKLSLRVDTGGVAVTPEMIPNISIEFIEGSGVIFGYDRGSDIFRLEPETGNLSPVAVRTPTGFYPRIMPGTRLTFVINRSTFTSEGDEGALIFSELAGAGSPIFRGGNPTRILPTGRGETPLLGGTTPNLDTSRIEQPPVTTFE